jgi:hypothetical protein
MSMWTMARRCGRRAEAVEDRVDDDQRLGLRLLFGLPPVTLYLCTCTTLTLFLGS